MSDQPRPASPLFTQVDITPAGQTPTPAGGPQEANELLRDIVNSLDRNNELIEELVNAMGAAQKQRAAELKQWKQANPELAQACREAAEGLSQVQIEFLRGVTREVNETAEELKESDFMLNEFVDRFGPRLAHLNGVIQVLAQLSTISNSADATQP